MFSKKHYINWFSLIFIAISIIIFSSNIQLLKNEPSVLINNLFGSILLIIIFFIVDKYLNPEKIDLFIVSFTFILSFISYFFFFPFGFYLIFLLFFFRNNLKNLFVAIFLIFLFDLIIKYYMIGNYSGEIFYWDFPFGWIILVYLLSIYTGWMVADMQEVYFSTGIIIFFWSLIFLISDNNTAFLNSTATASFLISIPFFLSSFRRYKVDKFLGKVYKNL
jgi:hypothetical protein